MFEVLYVSHAYLYIGALCALLVRFIYFCEAIPEFIIEVDRLEMGQYQTRTLGKADENDVVATHTGEAHPPVFGSLES